MNKMTVLLLSATIISGCTSSVPLIKKTQSGKPEGVYQNTTKDKVKDALVNYCNSRGLIIYNADNSSVICGKELEGGSAVFGQMLIGNAYSTTPVSKVRFTIAQVNNDKSVGRYVDGNSNGNGASTTNGYNRQRKQKHYPTTS